MKDIVFLRLQTGEELIAQQSGNKYAKCAVLVPNGQGSISIMPWMPYTKGTQDETGVTIADEHITFKTTPVQELLNEYNTHFGSGLVMPNKEILKG